MAEAVRALGKRTSAKASEILQEKVGSQFLSLRQSVRTQHSPVACKRARSPISTGFTRKAPDCEAPAETHNSLSQAFFSKPPDFADLVRNS
jgi:hypothetical protein